MRMEPPHCVNFVPDSNGLLAHLISGLVLSMAVDPHENWVALGTSLGYHVIWDMRFQLPIRHWQHTGHQKCMSINLVDFLM